MILLIILYAFFVFRQLNFESAANMLYSCHSNAMAYVKNGYQMHVGRARIFLHIVCDIDPLTDSHSDCDCATQPVAPEGICLLLCTDVYDTLHIILWLPYMLPDEVMLEGITSMYWYGSYTMTCQLHTPCLKFQRNHQYPTIS
jgi:hypothetical protein